jgi:hypothetical protein
MSIIERGIFANDRACIKHSVSTLLQGFEGVAICLQHLYPACQANPDFLKGGDQLLYDILKDDYIVTVVPTTIYRKVYDEYDVYGKLREAEICSSTCCVKPYIDNMLSHEGKQLAEESASVRTIVVIASCLFSKHVLLHELINYLGNDSDGEETVYMVAALHVLRKTLKRG